MLGWRGMAGLIVPSNNNVILPELYRLLPEGVTAYETRMRAGAFVTGSAIERMVQDALAAGELLAEASVEALAYCCMGSTIYKGWEWEEAILARLREVVGCPVTSANQALLDAIRHVGAKRVAFVTPYPKELDERIPDFFAARDIEATTIVKVKVPSFGAAPAHNRDIRNVEPDYLHGLVRKADLAGAQAVCFLATDMTTLPVLEPLERDLGLPVLGNNQAIAWALLRDLGVKAARPGFGRLLSSPA